MREAQFLAVKRAGERRDSLILAQFIFLKTRQEAFEEILEASTWFDRLSWMLWPLEMLAAADRVQARLIAEENRKISDAASSSAARSRIVRP